MASDEGLNGIKTATRLILLEQKGLDEVEDEPPELDLLGLQLRAQQRSANLTRAGRGGAGGAKPVD